MKRSLSQAKDPQGRLDVLLYQLAGRVMERVERDRGLVGIRENLLPIVEQAIVQIVPRENMIPREIRALVKVCQQNVRGKC